MTGISGDFSQVKFICTVRQFCEKINLFSVIPSKMAKFRYFFHPCLFTFHVLDQLLLPTVTLNGVSEPLSI